jgi:hypothetical protein
MSRRATGGESSSLSGGFLGLSTSASRDAEEGARVGTDEMWMKKSINPSMSSPFR